MLSFCLHASCTGCYASHIALLFLVMYVASSFHRWRCKCYATAFVRAESVIRYCFNAFERKFQILIIFTQARIKSFSRVAAVIFQPWLHQEIIEETTKNKWRQYVAILFLADFDNGSYWIPIESLLLFLPHLNWNGCMCVLQHAMVFAIWDQKISIEKFDLVIKFNLLHSVGEWFVWQKSEQNPATQTINDFVT